MMFPHGLRKGILKANVMIGDVRASPEIYVQAVEMGTGAARERFFASHFSATSSFGNTNHSVSFLLLRDNVIRNHK